MNEIVDFLLRRRSVKAVDLTEPGPAEDDLEKILRAGMRVPDHGKLTPWRFIVIRGTARERFGDLLATVMREEEGETKERKIEFARAMPLRAPVIIAVLSRGNPDHKIPLWEQELSAGAACQTMLIAATALGYGAQWITEWPAYRDTVLRALGGGGNDRLAGFLYIGTPVQAPEERDRPAFEDIVTEWTGPDQSG